MNGRVYDPTLGRFIQADPHIQAPEDTQNLNRYSYVNNNPLSYDDPTGYFLNKLFKGLNKLFGKLAPFVGIIAMFIPGLQAWALASFQNAFVMGFVAGGIGSGSLKGALIGGFTAMAFKGIAVHLKILQLAQLLAWL